MQLPVQTFTGLVQRMVASLQGGCAQLLDLTVGSVLRALLEASASVALWMQYLILQTLAATRAATSIGSDLDSWMADFGLSRLPATQAGGTVTFARYSAGLDAIIPLGATVRTTDGTCSYVVVASAANSAWNGGSGYVLPAAASSVDVPVQAMVAGAAGNVQPGTISLLATAIAGVDTVTNAAAMAGGMDAESDDALRARFHDYINSRSLATILAVSSAIEAVQQGVRFAVAENQDTSGAAVPGSFVVTVDDGTGNASEALLSAVQMAVEAVRPVGSAFAVLPSVVIEVSVLMSVEVGVGASKASIAAAVENAVQAWIGALPMGGLLAVSKIVSLAHAVDPRILSVGNVRLNGQAADLNAPPNGVLQSGSIVVS